MEPDMEPDLMEPDVMEPDIMEPDIMEPDIMEPDIMEPDIMEPDLMEPDLMEPDIMRPDTEAGVGSLASSAEVGNKPLLAKVIDVAASFDQATLVLTGIDEGLGHALGDVISCLPGIATAGYRRPHPLFDEHFIMIHGEEGVSLDVESVWQRTLDRLDSFLCNVRGQVPDAITVDNQEWIGSIKFSRQRIACINALRRAILTDVPTLAITNFTVLKNTSRVCDEILIERISLLPMRTTFPQKKNDGVQISLHQKHPRLNEQGPSLKSQKTVTSQHLTVDGDHHPHYINALTTKKNGCRTRDPSDAFPLAVLFAGEEIDLRATATLGTGRMHARFSAVGPMTYRVTKTYPDSTADVELGLVMTGQLTVLETLASAAASLHAHLVSLRDLPAFD